MKVISRWLTCLTILALVLILPAPAVYAQPVFPHAFYGTVEINGSDAPTGTIVKAKVGGVDCGSYTTTEVGKYGSLERTDYLAVQGNIDTGATINFYVNGVDTTQTASFIPGGGPTELNLTVTISAPPAGGGAPPAGSTTVEASLFGGTVEFSIDSKGVIQETIEATSEDGNLTVTIPKDTIALDKDGEPLESLEAAVDESPPDPPEGAHIIGLAYDFGPDGAIFDPSITFTWTYDPDDLPEDVAEEDLGIAYYDEDAGEWVELDCVVDTENDTITASVEHFTTFAIIGAVTPPPPPAPAAFSLSNLTVQPTEVESGEAVTITVSVANTGGTEGSYTIVLKINGVKEAEKSVTLAAGGSEIVTFSVTREEAGSYSVTVDGLSGSFTVVALAAFSVTNLSIQPTEVEPGEAVAISLSIANTGGTEGSYTVVLKINGVKEAEKSVTLAAGGSEIVTFSVTREEAGSYSVTVDSLSGSFTVVAPALPPEEEEEVPSAPARPPINWPLVGGIIAAVVVVVGLVIFFVLRRRTA